MSSVEPEPPDEATLWEEKITRAVDTGEAEFTWKYVSPFILETLHSPNFKRCGAYLCTSIYP